MEVVVYLATTKSRETGGGGIMFHNSPPWLSFEGPSLFNLRLRDRGAIISKETLLALFVGNEM